MFNSILVPLDLADTDLAKPAIATAATLSQFCDDHPKATLHFLTQKELLQIKSVPSVVKIRSTSSTSCQKIKGMS